MANPIAPLLRLPLVQNLTRDVLLSLPPERAHRTTILALRLGAVPEPAMPDGPELATQIAGLELVNPLGMGAGFDKNGEVPQALSTLGFGMVEIGTVTPRPQSGNPRPRLVRLGDRDAVINRMGFNNEGHERVLRRIEGLRMKAMLGVNIGANKQSDDFVADFVLGVRRFADAADYLAVNVSSPNTPGLRNLQAAEALRRLLGEVLAERARARTHVPVFLKLAPDLSETEMDDIAAVIGASDLDGIIATNTTISRDAVAGHALAGEPGGLSGAPIFALTTRRLAQMRLRLGKDMPIIGVGGIHSAESAIAKIEAGADAIQLYTAMVFSGLGLVDDIKAGLVAEVKKRGCGSVAGLRDARVEDWAAGRVSLA
ncbi:MAG: quinone-dependent dihydroorotate dehydrogenase [Alphaproteobacteria bacterium]|nr:quinone-dependent dihydroorotate dehydrogenase [Alphaproteobacteria bacterium]